MGRDGNLIVEVRSHFRKPEHYILKRLNVHAGDGGTATLVWFANEMYLVQNEGDGGEGPYITVPASILDANPHPKRRLQK